MTGSNNEALDWASFDLRKYIGQTAQIQIMDENTGGWGHLNADQFTFADAPAQSSTQRAHWVDWGADFYAATSFTDLPHGRQVLIGWMNNWNYGGNIPTSPWRSAMSIPRELGLQRIDGRLQLTQRPVSHVAGLRSGQPMTARNQAISGTVPLPVRGADPGPRRSVRRRNGQAVRRERPHRKRPAHEDRLRHHHADRVHRPNQVRRRERSIPRSGGSRARPSSSCTERSGCTCS